MSALSLNLIFARGIPKVLSTHGGFWHTGDRKLLKQFYSFFVLPKLLKIYAKILATSHSDAEFFQNYASCVRVVENGVDTDKYFGKATPKQGLLRWLYWGRLSKNKRIDNVISLFAQASRNGLASRLIIAGPDFNGESSELQSQVKQLQLNHLVKIYGPQDEATITGYISESDVFVTASEHEGFGLGVIEALSAGLLVFCHDIAPLNHFVIDGKNGAFLKFDGSDISKLQDLCSIPSEKVTELSAQARATASAYSWVNANRNFLEEYEGALSC